MGLRRHLGRRQSRRIWLVELNTKGRYAVMAMAELARHASDAALPLSQIAEQQKLPLPYLEQLFLQLRRAGLVDSARGRLGGYRLARGTSEISVADVMSAVEEETHFTRCTDEAHGCQGGERCITHGLWQGLSDATSAYLKSVTLNDIVASKGNSLTNTASFRVYLDYNATAPLRPKARRAMNAALDVTGNASSVHGEGRRARGIVEAAREDIARLLGAKPSEVVFTSGATEANAWVMAQGWDTIFVAGIEHDSVLAPAKASGAQIVEIPVGADGVARIDALSSHMARHMACHITSGAQPEAKLGRALVVLQIANNETGVIQPVAEFAALAREHGLPMHVDAVQGAGRLEIDFAALGVTTVSVSAHKMGGPKGVGALLIRDQVDLVPFVRGGGQERRRRAGTENIAAIAGFGAAAADARATLVTMPRIAALRDRLEAGVRSLSPNALVIGADAPRLANTSAIALPGKHAESLVIKLDLAGMAVSAGAACSSGKVGASHVLQSMGFDGAIAGAAIRVSLGPETTENDIAAFLAAWKTIVSQSALAA